ncbi:MAG: LysM peptidoglycan-binding domain-containing protein, partial [Bacteroidota bacterium]
MVRKEGKGKFLVSPILSAAYFRFDDGALAYSTKEYAFEYNIRKNQRNINLNTLSTATEIFFVGSTNFDCRKGYTFSVSDRNGGLSDLTILPEVGIIDNVAFNNKRRLSTINATNFRDFLNAVCNGNTIYSTADLAGIQESDIDFDTNNFSRKVNNTPKTSTSTATLNQQEEDIYLPLPSTTPRSSKPLNTVSTNNAKLGISPTKRLATDVAKGNFRTLPVEQQPEIYSTRGGNKYVTVHSNSNGKTHTVQKGETAYSIAKAYNITLAQLQTWNKLSGFTIYPDQQLIVRPYGNTANDTFLSRGGNRLSNPANVNPLTRPTTIATGTNISTRTPDNRYKVPAWSTTDGIHVVQNGETLRTIANAYGYTLARFLDLNGLSENTVLSIGQRLKTTDCYAKPEEPTSGTTNAVRTNYFDNDFTPKGSVQSENITPISPAPYSNAQSRIYGAGAMNGKTHQIHRVQNRETLFTIAQNYNTSVGELMRLNGMEVAEAL